MFDSDLHRHLDCCFRSSTIAELWSKRPLGTADLSTAALVEKNFWVTKPLDSLKTVLDRFVLFQHLLNSEVIFERVAYEAALDASQEGLKYVEFRYSPSFASDPSQISWEKALNAFDRGIQRAQAERPISACFIGILSRDLPFSMAEKSLEFFLKYKNHFRALDLAGNEDGFPAKKFAPLFKCARDAGLGITVHAGEACGPESIWSAIDELGAQRIGHGVAAAQDKNLLRRMERDQILIECCPTSNLMTGAVQSIEKHPLPRFLDAGIPCGIGADDPGIFGNSVKTEASLLKKTFGFGPKEFSYMNACSEKFAFRPSQNAAAPKTDSSTAR